MDTNLLLLVCKPKPQHDIILFDRDISNIIQAQKIDEGDVITCR